MAQERNRTHATSQGALRGGVVRPGLLRGLPSSSPTESCRSLVRLEAIKLEDQHPLLFSLQGGGFQGPIELIFSSQNIKLPHA